MCPKINISRKLKPFCKYLGKIACIIIVNVSCIEKCNSVRTAISF